MDDCCRLVLLPGLGADARQWMPQKRAFPHLLTPAWTASRRRHAGQLFGPAGRDHPGGMPPVLGGSSFGGMVAWEMARHLHPIGVILIGSCRGPQAINRDVRMLGPLLAFCPFPPDEWQSRWPRWRRWRCAG